MMRKANRTGGSLCLAAALTFFGCMALASGTRHLAGSSFASAFATTGGVTTYASSTPGGSASAFGQSGSNNAFSGSVDGVGNSFANDGTSTVYGTQFGSSSSFPTVSSNSDGSLSAVAGGGHASASAFGGVPSCQDINDFNNCCNQWHQQSSECKCTLSPTIGSLSSSFWKCDAYLNSPGVWKDRWTGKQCSCY